MSFTVRDYEYIRNHMDEYQYTMSIVKQEVNDMFQEQGIDIGEYPQELHERGLEITFYKKLLDSGEMSMPEKCTECPFHSIRLNSIGQVCDNCDINTNTYVGNMFFSSSKKKPKWCPLIKK